MLDDPSDFLVLHALTVACANRVLPNCLNTLSAIFGVQDGGDGNKVLEVDKHSGVAGKLGKYVV